MAAAMAVIVIVVFVLTLDPASISLSYDRLVINAATRFLADGSTRHSAGACADHGSG